MKIVNEPLKTDLHIHSCCSEYKEKNGRTKSNTIQNLSVLINALNTNHVNLCSITDHDCFSYDFYSSLKKEEGKGSIQKVLPGVEFSLKMNGDLSDKIIHVIAIFNDEDELKIRKIETLLGKGGKTFTPICKDGKSFSEDEFIQILRKIDADVALIVHQKQTTTSQSSPQKRDFNSLGPETCNELIAVEYFQALEFHDKNNEIFNIKSNSKIPNDALRYITGSDCHEWVFYPYNNQNEINRDSFRFTYLKCLPCFRGLALSLTDSTRISLDKTFFTVSNKYIPEIKLKIEGKEKVIPLSKGINAIIGDNSIGKSLLLHKLTNYYKRDSKTWILNKSTITGYDKYLERHDILVETQIPKDFIFEFDSQGEIREKFRKNMLNCDNWKSKYYLVNPHVSSSKKVVNEYFNEYLLFMNYKFSLDKLKKKLLDSVITIPTDDLNAKELKYSDIGLDTLNSSKTKINNVITQYTNAISSLNKLRNVLSSESEKAVVDRAIKTIEPLKTIYDKKLAELNCNIVLAKSVNNVFSKLIEENKQVVKTSDDQLIELFSNSISAFCAEIISYHRLLLNPISKPILAKEIAVPPEPNDYHDYSFITKCSVTKIDDLYLRNLLTIPFKVRSSFDVEAPNEDEFLGSLKANEDNDQLHYYQTQVQQQIEADFKPIYSITKPSNLVDDHSDGLNDQMYFGVISYETKEQGIFIIDQPEDDISSVAIKTHIVPDLKNMSRNRQVILVTHNPQFVVNLDVDNVIFIHNNKEKTKIEIDSGALEYKDENIDILADVAESLDGGLNTIKKRWKRYEKKIDDIIG